MCVPVVKSGDRDPEADDNEGFAEIPHEREIYLDVGQSTNVNSIRAALNPRLVDRPEGYIPYDEALRFLRNKLESFAYPLAIIRYGQKLNILDHTELPVTLLNCKNAGFIVDLALAIEIGKEGQFLSLARDPQSS